MENSDKTHEMIQNIIAEDVKNKEESRRLEGVVDRAEEFPTQVDIDSRLEYEAQLKLVTELVVKAFGPLCENKDKLEARKKLQSMGIDLNEIDDSTILLSEKLTKAIEQLEKK